MSQNLILGFDNMKVHEKLRALRNARGISQSYMADRLNIDAANYGRMERGQTQLTVERLNQILEILEVKADIFSWATQEEPSDPNTTDQETIPTLLNEQNIILKEILEKLSQLKHHITLNPKNH